MVSDINGSAVLHWCAGVLILVLMEYGLWQAYKALKELVLSVLILVLMEYGLWLIVQEYLKVYYLCLNPCSNGIWSLTKRKMTKKKPHYRLNPCSNGIWSLTITWRLSLRWLLSLNPCSNGIWSLTWQYHLSLSIRESVLILVLMEYGLWPDHEKPKVSGQRKS